MTAFILFATCWLSPFGVALWFLPNDKLFREDRQISAMIVRNVAAVGLSQVIVSLAVLMLSLFLLSFFGYDLGP